MNIPIDHPKIPDSKVGILIINLGTPEATDYFSMRKYLNQFLSDKRVIELPSILWQPILKTFILTFRPKKSGDLYKRIWNEKLNESPLKTNTRMQAKKIDKLINNKKNYVVDWAMRYGYPNIEQKINNLISKGCNKILIFPLYPQYSATTTASVMDNVFEVLKKKRWQPTVRVVPPYFDEKIYIDSLYKSIINHLKKIKWKPDALVCSFHGLPKKYFLKGDPYHCHCAKTKRLLKEKLNGKINNVELSFQSRFGPQEWLKPYMNEKFKELISNDQKKILIIAPGFASDCLETLEEIKIQGKSDFINMGGKEFSYVPCLNYSDFSISMLSKLVIQEVSGWK